MTSLNTTVRASVSAVEQEEPRRPRRRRQHPDSPDVLLGSGTGYGKADIAFMDHPHPGGLDLGEPRSLRRPGRRLRPDHHVRQGQGDRDRESGSFEPFEPHGRRGGANTFVGPFNDATDASVLKPGDKAVFVSRTGWTVTASTGDILKVANGAGGSVNYSDQDHRGFGVKPCGVRNSRLNKIRIGEQVHDPGHDVKILSVPGAARQWSKSPEVFASPCGLNSRSFNRTAATNETNVPDCDDPDAASWLERDVVSLSGRSPAPALWRMRISTLEHLGRIRVEQERQDHARRPRLDWRLQVHQAQRHRQPRQPHHLRRHARQRRRNLAAITVSVLMTTSRAGSPLALQGEAGPGPDDQGTGGGPCGGHPRGRAGSHRQAARFVKVRRRKRNELDFEVTAGGDDTNARGPRGKLA
jgi:hypothetical protein